LRTWRTYSGITQPYTYIQVQAQVLVDIAARAASALGLEVEGYVDAGYKLRTAGIIDEEDFRLYRRVVGFRNIVVHGYCSVSAETVREVIRGRRCRGVARLGLKVFDELRRRGFDP
jgi:uncharacterized protein YutE (UPF0331/DUF86 family)